MSSDWCSYTFDPFASLSRLSKWLGAESVAWLPDGPAKDFLGYWVYDFVKIAILLLLTTFVLNLLRKSIGVRWLRRSLGRDDWIGMCSGAALGVVTPVCSCSVTPLYASLLHAGATRRSAACFLFAAPAVNEFAIALMIISLGWKGSVAYVTLGLAAALLTGRYAHRLGLEPCHWCSPSSHDAFAIAARFGWRTLSDSAREAVQLFLKLRWALVIGACFAAALVKFNTTPIQILTSYGQHWFSPILAAVLGLPLDVNAVAAGPILIPLAEAGLPVGTLITLMMATTVASIPEAAILRQVVGWRSTLRLGLWYFAYTAGIGIALNCLMRLTI